MLLINGKKYRGQIILSADKAKTNNLLIGIKLNTVGFKSVKVEGTGTERTATGVWARPTQEAVLPDDVKDQVKNLTEV